MAPKLEGPAIGIDLGTTYSCVGVWRHNSVEILVNNQGKRTTPSCVAFTNSDRLIGEAAENQCDVNPIDTVSGVKRLIGRRFADDSVQNYISSYPFKVIEGQNKEPNAIVNYKGEQKQFSAEEISSMILQHMREIAEVHIGSKVKNAVVTVPAYFNNSQRQATRHAGNIIGLNILRIINEPIAAAIAYGLQDATDMENKNTLIFDLGGGTLDVSIVKVKGRQLKVKATAGDTSLGGEDFNNVLLNYFIKKFINQHEKDVRENPRAIRRLRSACERAKVALSYATETRIVLDYLHEGIHLQSTITRTMFEELNMDLFLKCIDVVAMCLWDINMKREDISHVVLVGGSTRIPKVEQLLREYLPKSKILKSVNPDEAVAYGATVLATKLVGETSKGLLDLVIHDVIPFSLGTEKLGGVMNVLIPRNTPIPTRKEWACSTVIDNQSCVTIRVYEGERELVEDNNLLGEFDLKGIAPAHAGFPKITVSYEIDADGVLTVMAKFGNRKPWKQITDGRCWMGTIPIERCINEAMLHKDEDTEKRNTARSKGQLECYLKNLKIRINDQETTRKLKPVDKNKMVNEIERVSDWLNLRQSADASEFDRMRLELEKFWELVSTRKSFFAKLR